MERGKLRLVRSQKRAYFDAIDLNKYHNPLSAECMTCGTDYYIPENFYDDEFKLEILKRVPMAMYNDDIIEHCPWCWEDRNKYSVIRIKEYKKLESAWKVSSIR